ncbi:PREDICTED: uncharacterized protein LOC108552390 [Eufriesea mexicana]|uniref:uncharacterized protein LOC108552390 n=1 Tax=Eufriesea mexicana TaxID=516756 RepID=UPI00083BF3A9|nr:PREDICTED: uncharacterized protein LOC108552390 [Eufriesea mexicana]
MHKRKLKINTLTQNIKTPENIPRVKDYQNNQNESSDYFQLPSLQKKKTWKDVDDNLSTWDRNSPTADVFCSSEIENITTRKVMQQWEAIENTLYEDGEQVTQTAILEECVQWRMQIPHLRIIGKNPFLTSRTNYQDLNINHNQIRSSSSSHNEDEFPEYSVSVKERKNSSKHKLEKTPQDEIFDMLYEYVISELFPNKENEIDSLRDDFNDVLQIRMAPIHSNKSSAKSTKVNWFEETIPLESRLSNNSGKAVEDHILPMRREIIQTYSQEVQKKHDNSMSNEKIKNEKHESNIEDKFFRPHTSRNKLGTVFNEKIVVSPVPYVLSTRESFSTVKTTPIKFMAQSLEVPIFQGSSKHSNYFKNSGRSSASVKISNYQSAWHAPVSPAVWPKNIKLAPLDTSRFPSSKNRSLTSSSVVLPRNRKPLSPISRPILLTSQQTIYNNHEGLEIQGRHITPVQSPKLNENTRSSKNRKKKSQLKTKLQ